MTLRERIQADITAAMRSGDALRRDTLRMAENAIYNAEKRDRRTYSDDEVAAILAREVKTRRESIEAFRQAGREELASREEAEVGILSGFMPQQLSADEIGALVDQAIAETGAAGPRDMGKVMGWLSSRTRGRADGRAVSQVASTRLGAMTSSASS